MRRLIWVAVCFLAISALTRIGLALFSGGGFTLGEWVRFMAVGLLFDVAVLPWFLLPWAVYDAVVPQFASRRLFSLWENRWAALWGALYLSLFVIIAVAEFAFWMEFGSRFDFIAVDYLVYTQEVIGNIRQSYPVNWWVAIILAVSFFVAWKSWPREVGRAPGRWIARLGRLTAVALAAGLSFTLVDQSLSETKSNAYVQQLSTNGVYAFGYAFRHNELDYARYYPTLEKDDLNGRIRGLVRQSNTKFTSGQGIERRVASPGPRRDVNVILITVESLSAEFLGIYGDKRGFTPELDKLAGKGLLFTNLYATGTRSVRGLEALSLGTPPTPGQSIVRRPNNENLENIGEELAENGWTSLWIYGGYGFFDNMNAYFGANGYRVIDRTAVDGEGITVHAENIWGIADEDMYSLALKNLDREYARGNRFYAHLMTTSNHRPYTFPEDRIDLPQKHRDGAVKYTDWAISDFIRRSSDKPWFKNTLFIITADHTAKAAGKTDLPPSRYLIPMIWYAPGLIEPGVMDRLMSQIDVGPTLLGWLGLDYSSRFFGYDMATLEAGRERAFISTYQKLGYLKGGRLVELDVNKDPVIGDGLTVPKDAPPPPGDEQLIAEAIAWYQAADLYFRTGQLQDSVD